MPNQSNKQAASTSKDSAATFKTPATKDYLQTRTKVMNISSESQLVYALIFNLQVDAQNNQIDQKFTGRVKTIKAIVQNVNWTLGPSIEKIERKIKNMTEASEFSQKMEEVVTELSDSNTKSSSSSSSSSTAQPNNKRKKKSPMTFEFTVKHYIKTIAIACQAVENLVFGGNGNMAECSAILSAFKEVRDEILKEFIKRCKMLADEINGKTSSEQRVSILDFDTLFDDAAAGKLYSN